jgi:hypothetical protein
MTDETETVIEGYGELDPVAHILDDHPGWPVLVIELRRAPGHDGIQEMAVTPFDWYDGDETIPDVIVLESSVDVDVRVATDGRIVHVYRTHDDG